MGPTGVHKSISQSTHYFRRGRTATFRDEVAVRQILERLGMARQSHGRITYQAVDYNLPLSGLPVGNDVAVVADSQELIKAHLHPL